MKFILTIGMTLILASSCFGQSLTEADQLAVEVQKICPVSGAELGSMGDPVKVKVGEQHAFLCCKGCQGKKLSSEHWKTIQARLAEAQKLCPIMEKPVDASMESTVVNGQQIFVCCPPCIKKIKDDPDAAIEKVKSAYTKFIADEKLAVSEQIHIRAQAICPVTGKELGSMGDPIKVKVGKEEHAFLCCKGCVGKKLDAEHWKTIQQNLATAQGICPIMEKPVDASMKSTVVNGRKIFVCCPPCIKKIQADPEKYIKQLDLQIVDNLKQ